jgi:hypothetical protein
MLYFGLLLDQVISEPAYLVVDYDEVTSAISSRS